METIRDYHLKKKDSEFLRLLNNSAQEIPTIDQHIQKKDFFYSYIPIPSFLGDIKPIIAVKAISPLLQPLFFDKWGKHTINPASISIKKDQYPKDLHIVV